MTVLLVALGSFLAALAAQVAAWAARVPRRQTRAILVIHAVALALGLVIGYAYLPGALGVCRAALLFLSLSAAWIITYSAIEAQSPSLSIMILIARAGAGGMPAQALAREMSDEVLIIPRIEDLVRDKMVRLADATYRLTAKGRWFVRVFMGWRALLGLPRGG